MQPEPGDPAHLWEMPGAAQAVLTFIEGVRGGQYMQDRRLQMAFERAVEIIGEAARRVSEQFKRSRPEIPWRGIFATTQKLHVPPLASGRDGGGFVKPALRNGNTGA